MICWSYSSRVMAWPRSRVVAVISGPGRAGQYQVPSARMAPPVLAYDAGLVYPVVHDRPVDPGRGRAAGSGPGARRYKHGRSRAHPALCPRVAAEARTRAPVPPGSCPGRASARAMARSGCAGGAPGGRAVVAMVASSARRSSGAACPCRPPARGGRLRGRTSRRRGRWRTGRHWTGRGRTAVRGWRPARCSRRRLRVRRWSGR